MPLPDGNPRFPGKRQPRSGPPPPAGAQPLLAALRAFSQAGVGATASEALRR